MTKEQIKNLLLNSLDLILQDMNKFTDELDKLVGAKGGEYHDSPAYNAGYSAGVWASKQIILEFMGEIEKRVVIKEEQIQPRYITCGSCKMKSPEPTEDGECPNCRSGNWVWGEID